MAEQEWYAQGLRFTCTQCGNCCTGSPGYVWFTESEAQAMAARVGFSVPEFYATYAHRVYGRWSLNERLTEHGHDCVFLVRDATTGKALCTLYEARPQQCRTWPFWPENLKSPRAWRQAAARCPGMDEGIAGRGKLYPIEAIRIQRDSTP
jgi:uncharacterized protein